MPTPAAPKVTTSRSWLIATLASLAISGWGVAWFRGANAPEDNSPLETASANAKDTRALEDKIRALEFENMSLKNQQAAEPERPEQADQGDGQRRNRNDGPPNGFGGPGGFMGRMAERMKNDPAFAQLIQAETLRRMEERYAGLIKQLKLNPEQAKQFLGLLASREIARQTAMASARENGVDPRDSAAMSAYLAKSLESINGAIEGVVGSSGVSQLSTWENTTNLRNQVSQFETKLAASGLDLQSYQKEGLSQVLSSTTSTASRPGRNADATAWSSYFEQRQAEIANTVTRAQSVLTTQQAQTLSEMLTSQLASEQLRYQVQQTEQAAREARRAQQQAAQASGGN